MLATVLATVPAAAVGLPAEAAASQPRCLVADPRLDELSGLAVDPAGLWGVVDDGRRVDLHRIDLGSTPAPAPGLLGDCPLADTRTARIDPRDTEDLALGPDGALWVADTGDNELKRATVAVIVVPVRGTARLYRLSYPDGPHDAEAMVVDATGAPVIVTKDPVQPAGVYRTERPLTGTEGPGPTPLIRVGELVLPPSDTVGGPVGGLGRRLVTGAAVTADRTAVAVRTYTDAWLYPVPDGDLAGALARPDATPVRVPLPGEPQGEAITFEPDGTLLSGSEARDGVLGEIRAVPGAAALVGSAAPVAPERVASGLPGGADSDPATPGWAPAALGGLAVAGLLGGAALVLRRR